ncbi:MAG: TauD/TfdA family dioxygenase [Magnetovibrio sp.]|nr:TauD/TfdA family dioxygenase [Magnetovibrio sp.]
MNATLTKALTIQSPFDLSNTPLFERWCDAKLKDYPTALGDLVVKVNDPRQLTVAEHAGLLSRLRKANMAVYVSATGDDADRDIPLKLASQLGALDMNHNWLSDDDGLTSLTVVDEGARHNYIPYTDRAIKWHTDGYYNTANQQIQSLNLHCVSPAATGGENRLTDHEMAYMLMRQENPEFIKAFMAPDAMTIPARIDEAGTVARREEKGPVFSVCPNTGNLHMRHTIRERNVIWKDNAITRQAEAFLENLLESDCAYIYQGRLEPGMGLVSTNVLHDRAAFADDETHTRLIYRARYFDRLKGTNLMDVYPELLD